MIVNIFHVNTPVGIKHLTMFKPHHRTARSTYMQACDTGNVLRKMINGKGIGQAVYLIRLVNGGKPNGMHDLRRDDTCGTDGFGDTVPRRLLRIQAGIVMLCRIYA